MRLSIIIGLAALALVTVGLAGSAPQAQANVNPGPPSILQAAVSGCPVGVEVTVNPGPISLPGVGIFMPPGPPSLAGGACAQGIAIFMPPGPAGTAGMAFGLPLNAADCADGTAALNDILTALGGTPVAGALTAADPIAPPDACPTGTAAMDGIENAIIDVQNKPPPIGCPQGTVWGSPAIFGMRGTLVLFPPGSPDCPPATALLVQQNAAGTARGFLGLSPPGPPNSPASLQLFRIRPGSVAGESLLQAPGPPE